MKINNLSASFSNSESRTISFHNGLNIVREQNCNIPWGPWIQTMLYGMNPPDRSALPQAAQWPGTPTEGVMELTADQCEITISRVTTQKNRPLENFSAFYTGTEQSVEGIEEENCGEILTGVTASTFLSRAFLKRESALSNGEKVEQFLLTGDEQTSADSAALWLNTCKEKNRNTQNGEIPKLDAEIQNLQKKIAAEAESSLVIDDLERQLKNGKKECAKLEASIIQSRSSRRRNSVEQLEQARVEMNRLCEEEDSRLNELDEKRQKLKKSLFGNREPNLVEAEAEKDVLRLTHLQPQIDRKNQPFLAILFFVLAILSAIVYENLFQHLAMIIVAGICCVVAVVLFLLYFQLRKKILQAKEERDRILKKYNVSELKAIQPCIEKHRLLWATVKQAETEERAAGAAAEKAIAQFEAMEQQEARTDSQVTELELRTRLIRLREEVNLLASRLPIEKNRHRTAYEERAVMISRLAALQERRNQLLETCEAMELAAEAIQAAGREGKERIAPAIQKLAKEYMQCISGKRVESLLNIQGEEFPELVHFLLKLAVCDLSLPAGETFPLILEYALDDLKEERYRQAMILLREISKQRQVILFTGRVCA